MGANDTLRKVAMHVDNSDLGDSLAFYAAEEFAAGFKKTSRTEARQARASGSSNSESWHLLDFSRRDGVHMREGHAVQGGHVEHHWFGGHARIIYSRQRSSRLASRRRWLSGRASSSRTEARQTRASGSST